jgi:hypothetical protein
MPSKNETVFKNTLASDISSYTEQGLASKFQMVFGFPLLYVDTANRKENLAKRRSEESYPFCFASIDSFSVNRASYNAKSLLRQGLKSQSTDDRVNNYTLNLIPMKTVYSLSLLFQSREEVTSFAKQWLRASIAKSLNFSLTYGVSDIDIHCSLAENLSMPKPEIGIAETREFELITQVEVDGYSNSELKKEQAATSLETEGVLKSLGETQLEALAHRPDSQIFLFKR